MKVISIVSRKGGAGKTTIALHLAVGVEALGLSVAVFDLDPQASAALWGDRRTDPSPAVVPAQAPRLAALLAQARSQSADLVILDTAPHADSIASEAASHSDAILIPCRPSTLDLDAIGASVRLANGAGKPAYVIVNAAPIQGAETQQMRSALEEAGVQVSPVVLHQRKAFSSFLQEGRTALEMEPKGRAAEEVQALTKWVCDHVVQLTRSRGRKVIRQRAGEDA
jgi:chromosome partitioning protein